MLGSLRDKEVKWHFESSVASLAIGSCSEEAIAPFENILPSGIIFSDHYLR